MPQNPNNDVLRSLRAIVDAGGPQTPVRSGIRSTGTIGPNKGTSRLREQPISDSPLDQANLLDAIGGQGTSDLMGDVGNVGLGANPGPIGWGGKARPALEAFRPKQPMPSPRRMDELIERFGGSAPDLPMDEASRMARADDLGYTHDVYHGTSRDFTEFNDPVRYGGYGVGDFGIHVSSDPGAANMRATSSIGDDARGDRVMPLRAQINNPVTLPDMGIWKDPLNYVRKADDHFYDPDGARNVASDPDFLNRLSDEAQRVTKIQNIDKEQQMALWQHKMRELMQESGYDAIKYANHVESDGAPSYLLMDPRQLRSRFAKFDPNRANSRDLMASLAAAIGGGAAVSHKREDE